MKKKSEFIVSEFIVGSCIQYTHTMMDQKY